MTAEASAIEQALGNLAALSDAELGALLEKAQQLAGDLSGAVSAIREEQSSRGT